VRVLVVPQAPPLEEPITPTQLEALARIIPADREATLWPGYISAARQQVEHDTERILISTDCLVIVAYDLDPWFTPTPGPLVVHGPATVTAARRVTRDNLSFTLAPSSYRIVGADVHLYPPARSTDRIEYEVTLGRASAEELAALDPSLVHAVGIAAVHYVTSGRDLVAIGADAAELPLTYHDAIQSYRVESLA
jgi:hypothetical protein